MFPYMVTDVPSYGDGHGLLPIRNINRFTPGIVRAGTMASPPPELAVDIPGLEIPKRYLSVIPSSAIGTPVSRFRFHVLQE